MAEQSEAHFFELVEMVKYQIIPVHARRVASEGKGILNEIPGRNPGPYIVNNTHGVTIFVGPAIQIFLVAIAALILMGETPV